MISEQDIRIVYKQMVLKKGLSIEEIIARHTLAWVLGLAYKNPIDFVYLAKNSKINKALGELKRYKEMLKDCPGDKGLLDRLCDAQCNLLELL